jgi:hypothetical protein
MMTMNTLSKKLAVTVAMIIVLLSYTLTNINAAFSSGASGKVDLFTQKEPYSGKGPDMPSDAFGPQEPVILYALVLYNEVPFPNSLVTFYVRNPKNESFSFTAKTNISGIATVNFAIPQSSEFFGEWFALANVSIGSIYFRDTLTFKVDWVVKLISVRTIDNNLTYRTTFGRGDVGLEVTLRSIAMVGKNATFPIVIKDELNVPVSHLEISDFEVQPNEQLILIYCKLHIPEWAYVGRATAYVSALTTSGNSSGVPYCPSVSTVFSITSYEPLTVALHDVAVVKVVPSVTSIEVGQPVNISVIARNEGTETESFNVGTYCGSMLFETLQVLQLAPYSQATLDFTLNTSIVGVGNYTLNACIPYLTNEADLEDNIFVDGIIEIKSKPPTIVHDIAIVDVCTSNDSLYIGELLQVNVTVINKGTETETSDVNAYYNFSLIETLQIADLAPSAQMTLIFNWNTSNVQEGFYQISASAPLPVDVNISDNEFIDGIVQVKAKPPSLIHDIAVLNVVPSSTLVYVGETVNISVCVKNEGAYTESFNVTAFYDSNIVGTLLVDCLESNAEKTLFFCWDTQNVTEGNYTLSALASAVLCEENLENNCYVDGVVKVVVAPKGWFPPEWFCWFLLLILILIIVSLIIWLYLRKGRKKTQEAFHSGWTAWYYGYDFRAKSPKNQNVVKSSSK